MDKKTEPEDLDVLELLAALESSEDQDRDAKAFLKLYRPWAKDRLRNHIN